MERDFDVLLARGVFTGPHELASGRRGSVAEGAIGDAFAGRIFIWVVGSAQFLDLASAQLDVLDGVAGVDVRVR